MRLYMLPIMLIGWPLAEIAGFVLAGRIFGLWITLALVLGSAICGILMLRRQGLRLFRVMAEQRQQGRLPERAMVDGAAIMLAGIMLLLPGFLSDIIAFSLLIPPLRRVLWSRIADNFIFVGLGGGANSANWNRSNPVSQSDEPKVVDLDDSEFHHTSESRPQEQRGDLPKP